MEQRYKSVMKWGLWFILLVFLAVGVSGCTATRHTVQKVVIPVLDTSIDDLVDQVLRLKMASLSKMVCPGHPWWLRG